MKLVGRPLVDTLPESVGPGASALVERVFRTGVTEMLPEHRPVARGAKAPTAGPRFWSYVAWPIIAPVGAGEAQTVGVMIQVTDTTEIATLRRDSVAINAALLEVGRAAARDDRNRGRSQPGPPTERGREHEARLAAESADRSKEIFLATLSHELRTPSNAILGWAVMLQETGPDGTRVERNPDHALVVIERKRPRACAADRGGARRRPDRLGQVLARPPAVRPLHGGRRGRGAQACVLATQTDPPPDVLVADVAIPGEDGYALLRQIRDSSAGARQLPAVAVTALGSLEVRREALLAGFQVHMHKPIDPLLLIATVARLSGRLTPS